MKKTDWRDIEKENNRKNGDVQSLWANFVQFPKEYDDNDTLLRAGVDAADCVDAAECDAHLLSNSPTPARNRRSRRYGCRRLQFSRSPNFSHARQTRQHLGRATRHPRMFQA